MAPSGTSSRARYRDYLHRRRTKGYDSPSDDSPGGAGGSGGGRAPGEGKKPKRSRGFTDLLRAFWRLVASRPSTKLVVAACLALVAFSGALGLLMPYSTKIAIDSIITDNPGPSGLPWWFPIPDAWRASTRDSAPRVKMLWILGGLLVALAVVRILIGMWGRWQMTRLTKRVQVQLQRRVFQHAVRLPLDRLHQLKSGGVSSLLRDDAGGAAGLLFHLLYNPTRAAIELVGILVVLAIVDWRMLLGGLILLPTVWLTHKTYIARIRPLYRDIRASRTSIDAHSAEAFGGMRVVRGFARESGEAKRFSTGIHYMTRQEILTWWWSRGVDIAWSLFIPLASTGVLVYCGRGVLKGELTIGDVMMFLAYLTMLLGPLEALASSATEMQNNLAALDRVLDVLDEPTEFASTPGGVVLDRASVRGEIRLEGVGFAYPRRKGRAAEAEPKVAAGAAGASHNGTAHAENATATATRGEPALVLSEVDLAVPAGATIALVGPSGSGKTTLCNLVARFYDPTRGRVTLDGRGLREIDVRSYRRLLGIVEQDVFLFDGTIAQNIAYGRRGVSQEQVRDAALAANAQEFIDRLEHGYDTLIGERGVRLSGGQKQRLAIARALLADPKILILDEATSNLDTESERLIQASLTRLMKGRTCFVIAHRLSTIRHADVIVVLDRGRIVERGTHEELLAKGGRYAEVLRLQIGEPREAQPV